jgi:hypothetical protein
MAWRHLTRNPRTNKALRHQNISGKIFVKTFFVWQGSCQNGGGMICHFGKEDPPVFSRIPEMNFDEKPV